MWRFNQLVVIFILLIVVLVISLIASILINSLNHSKRAYAHAYMMHDKCNFKVFTECNSLENAKMIERSRSVQNGLVREEQETFSAGMVREIDTNSYPTSAECRTINIKRVVVEENCGDENGAL